MFIALTNVDDRPACYQDDPRRRYKSHPCVRTGRNARRPRKAGWSVSSSRAAYMQMNVEAGSRPWPDRPFSRAIAARRFAFPPRLALDLKPGWEKELESLSDKWPAPAHG